MIDLGQKYPAGEPCCASPSGDKEKVSYPSLYFTHGEKIDFPDEGEAIIKFRKIESAENTRDPKDPKYRCELEVRGIEVKSGGKKKSDGLVSVGESMRKAYEKKMRQRDMEDEED